MNDNYTHVCVAKACSCEEIIRSCRAANETFCECYNMAPLDARGFLIVTGIVIITSILVAIFWNKLTQVVK
jgi:hypothetical protein